MGTAIFHTMALDLIAMNFLYAACFVMALCAIPLFPRMMLFAWCCDLTLQLEIANRTAAASMPHDIALLLANLLRGNLTKVLICAAIWLPYLLLSDRVYVTYRARVAVA